jgi:hypothetical protein
MDDAFTIAAMAMASPEGSSAARAECIRALT